MLKDNTVFVGNKPVMNYVLAVVTQFNNGADEVAIKARGKAISRAVDTAEIALNRFLDNVTKKQIITSTEIIDTFSLGRPKFSLYGTPRHGVITRFGRSGRHREIPAVDGSREGVLKLSIRNQLEEWTRVSRVVLSEKEGKLPEHLKSYLLSIQRNTNRIQSRMDRMLETRTPF
jgi:DNA-binding protein